MKRGLQEVQEPRKRRAQSRGSSGSPDGEEEEQRNGTGPQGREIDVSEPRRIVESSGTADMLPAGRVFPIQIGSALFRLSGASLCSDAPSYFSHFFSDQLHANGGRADVKTLYIDRDPDTFRDIALHLQGYHVVPRDGEHFVKLFADAQFYSLPRLTKQLFKSDIFISIGGTPFRIPRSTFSAPGDSPNYFSLGFAQWFSTPAEVFPGLDRAALLRPPSISPPSVPNKSPDTFAELMKMLQGYDIEIRGPVHRSQLLRDARYFHLKGLEQRLVPHEISYNLKTRASEILLRLEDIRPSGVSITRDSSTNPSDSQPGTVSYARPYTDDATTPHTLILETSSEPTSLFLRAGPETAHANTTTNAHALFHASTNRRMTSLLALLATKANATPLAPLARPFLEAAGAQAPDSDGAARVSVRVDGDTSLRLDGAEVHDVRAWVAAGASGVDGEGEEDVEWVVRRAQWRVRLEAEDAEEPVRVVLCAVKIDAFTTQQARNAERAFLGSV